MCQICESYHDNVDELNAHYENYHPANKEIDTSRDTGNVPCELCERKFRHAAGLRNHMIGVHGIAPKSKDVGRSKTLKGKMTLGRKKTAKSGDFRCEDCQRTFSRTYYLRNHLVSVHGRSLEDAKAAMKIAQLRVKKE